MKKNYITGIKKSSLKKEELESKRKLRFIYDVRDLNAKGFTVPRNPIRKRSKNLAENELKKILSKKENKKFKGRLFVKSLQNPIANGLIYTIVLKRRK